MSSNGKLLSPQMKFKEKSGNMVDTHGGDDGDMAGSEDSADEDVDVVITGA